MEELGLQSLWGRLRAKQKITEPDVSCGLTVGMAPPPFFYFFKIVEKIQVSDGSTPKTMHSL